MSNKLTDLPGVGPSIADDLKRLGVICPEDLMGKDPDQLYEAWLEQSGVPERCMLYVFRCVVYAMNTPKAQLNPELLKWWMWSDQRLKSRS